VACEDEKNLSVDDQKETPTTDQRSDLKVTIVAHDVTIEVVNEKWNFLRQSVRPVASHVKYRLNQMVQSRCSVETVLLARMRQETQDEGMTGSPQTIAHNASQSEHLILHDQIVHRVSQKKIISPWLAKSL
jgi:hypothetical protein